jgi:prephenate dehydrogenase
LKSPSVSDSTVAFLGLGLISGSLAGALKAAGWGGKLVGWGPRVPSLEKGLALGIIDDFSLDLDQVLSAADIVVIGAPPIATARLLPEVIDRAVQCGSPIVTDMASIKGFIVDSLKHSYPGFVPAHPIAGSEHSGVDSAKADLFLGREVILTPLSESEAGAVAAVEQMWVAAGARITHMSVSDHDAALAASSHAPHMMAYALTAMLEEHELAPMKHGGGALRDMTRIAASDPVMWRDIALTNRDALLDAMDALAIEHGRLRALIEASDGEAMEQFFAHCRQLRRDHDRILNPLVPSGEASD